MVARESRERTNMVNVGRDAMGQELHASKGTAGGDFGLISAMAGGVGAAPRRVCILPK